MTLCATVVPAVAQQAGDQKAATSAELLLPDTTCLFASIPNAAEFRKSFLKTDLGQLSTDDVMKPFADDIAAQIRSRLGETQLQLGVTWEDLETVASGEVCFAQLQPGRKKGAHCSVLLLDVAGKALEAQQFLAKVEKTMLERKAVKSEEQMGQHTATKYRLPKKPTQLEEPKAWVVLDGAQLIVCNHQATLREILDCRDASTVNTLKDSVIYSQVMKELQTQSDGLAPQLRWFIDPFTAADVVRAARGKRQRRRVKPMIQILQEQGFDAIRAAGGHVNLATKEHEVLHRSYVYAPAQTPEKTRYKGAARMLNFPVSGHVPPQAWVPRKLATFTSLNWKVLDGFNYSTSLIDQIVDSENFVDAVLESFKTDEAGPMIDIRQELLAFADDHILIFSDFDLPIRTDSERIIFGVRIKDRNAVEAGLEKLWKKDKQAVKVEEGKHIIWEISPSEDDDGELPDLVLGDPCGIDNEEDGDDGLQIPKISMAVLGGTSKDDPPYLLIANQQEFLREVLSGHPKVDQLRSAADFRHVCQMLMALGAGEDSLMFFSRTDEEFRAVYEMIKQGRMPQSESLLGKMLNRMLGPEEKNVLRKQEIDGKKLPAYQVVRRYFGPSGLFVKSQKDGLFVTGIMVSKRKLVGKQQAANANLTTALAK